MIIKIFFLFLLISFQGFSQTLTGDEINNICKEKIKSLIKDGRIEIEEKKIPDIVANGSITLEIDPSISFNNAFFDIKIFVDKKEYKRIRHSFRIKRFKDVIVCSKQIKPYEVITPDMINIEEREITNISSYIENEKDVIGKEAKMKINEGNIILSSYINERALINFGDIVTIIKNGHNFYIKAKGIAISKGYKGKEVSIRNLSSQKIVKGIVIDKGIVEVR